MNYLAHLYLSGNAEELIIGNFIADSVKGDQINNYSEGIKQGIKLHRMIDTFTDAHAIVGKSKEKLRTNYKKYAGIVVDIFYDHFLAIHWKKYSTTALPDYSKGIYRLLERNQHLFPEKSKLFYLYMVKYDILNSYAEVSGIERVLQGMSRRSTFRSNMENAATELTAFYELFDEEFQAFFPLLQEHIHSKKEELNKYPTELH